MRTKVCFRPRQFWGVTASLCHASMRARTRYNSREKTHSQIKQFRRNLSRKKLAIKLNLIYNSKSNLWREYLSWARRLNCNQSKQVPGPRNQGKIMEKETRCQTKYLFVKLKKRCEDLEKETRHQTNIKPKWKLCEAQYLEKATQSQTSQLYASNSVKPTCFET